MDALVDTFPALPRQQPFKTVFMFYKFATLLFFWLPIWTIRFIPTSGRPRPSWSLAKSLKLTAMRHISIAFEKIGGLPSPDYRAIKPGPGVDAEWIQPVPELICPSLSAVARAAEVEPVSIPGYWLRRPATRAVKGEKALYALHGGGYFQLSGHPSSVTSKGFVQLLSALPNVNVAFSLEYRLSRAYPDTPANSFPAALLDAIAGYVHLVNAGTSPADIIVAGDSAGGNLALALARYLTENAGAVDGLPAPPAALILLSPWADVGTSHEVPGGSPHTNYASDVLRLVPVHPPYSKRAFTGPFGLGAANFNAYISPTSLRCQASFVGFPRTFIAAGGAEQLLDSIRTLAARMQRDIGGAVTYFEARDGMHDWLMFDWFQPEHGQLLRAVRTWAEGL